MRSYRLHNRCEVFSIAKIGKEVGGPRRSSITGFPELAAVSVTRMRAGYAN